MGQVLVLNASYEPLNITTWRRAMVMLLKGKAEGLEHDPARQIRPDLLLPTVIRLRQFVRVPYKQLPLTRRNVFQRDGHACQYCGFRGEPLSIDHVHPRSRGGLSVTENCVPACLPCNGSKGDSDAFNWYRSQSFYDPRRAMALRAWTDGDLRLALRLLQWAAPESTGSTRPAAPEARRHRHDHQTRQAAAPLWRWQMAS